MKKIITSVVLGAVLVTSASMAFAETKGNTEKKSKVGFIEIEEFEDIDIENIDFLDAEMAVEFMELPTFKEYMDGMKELLNDVDKADMTSLEKIYNEIDTLEKAEKFEEASKKWDEFHKILDKYFKEDVEFIDIDAGAINIEDIDFSDVEIIGEFAELPSFKEYMNEMKDFLKDVDKADMTSLEKIYNKIDTLEKAEKFEEASEKWEEFDKILEKYFKEDVIFQDIVSEDMVVTEVNEL